MIAGRAWRQVGGMGGDENRDVGWDEEGGG